MSPEHQQRRDDNHWTADQVKQLLEKQLEGLRELLQQMDHRYQQRWESDQKAIEKVNEIRTIVTDLGNRMMSRDDVEDRIKYLESLLREQRVAAQTATDQHFGMNREKIESSEKVIAEHAKDITELKAAGRALDSGAQRFWERAAVYISVAIAIAALVSAFWKK